MENPQKSLTPQRYLTESWYNELIDDCSAIITEGEFTARWSLIQCYHEVGTRLLEEKDRVNSELLQGVAQDLGKSLRTIYYAVQFATKYPNLEMLPEGKNVSWTKIVKKYLPESKDESVDMENNSTVHKITCPNCGFSFDRV